MRQSRAPPLQTRCRAARLRGTFCRYGWRASQRLLESWRCGRPRVRRTPAAYAHARFCRAHPQVALHCIQKLIAYGYVRGKIVMVGNVKKWLVDVVMDTVMLRPPRPSYTATQRSSGAKCTAAEPPHPGAYRSAAARTRRTRRCSCR